MKIYISGKITGLKNYKKIFKRVEKKLVRKGFAVMNPACLPNNAEFTHSEYMQIALKMLSVCDAIFLLPNWKESLGAEEELKFALANKKRVLFEMKQVNKLKEKENV